MTTTSNEAIEKAIDKAYKKAGHNAYFENGFKAGVEWAKSDSSNGICLEVEEVDGEGWRRLLKGDLTLQQTGDGKYGILIDNKRIGHAIETFTEATAVQEWLFNMKFKPPEA